MKKPVKPKKFIEINKTATYDFNWVSKRVSLETFQKWIRDTTPYNAKDITIELKEDWQYDDCLTSLELAWTTREADPRYETNMKRYETKLRKYNNQK